MKIEPKPSDREVLAAASYPNPNDAKATLGVLVGDALDQSREHLAVGGFGFDLHETYEAEILLILPA